MNDVRAGETSPSVGGGKSGGLGSLHPSIKTMNQAINQSGRQTDRGSKQQDEDDGLTLGNHVGCGALAAASGSAGNFDPWKFAESKAGRKYPTSPTSGGGEIHI